VAGAEPRRLEERLAAHLPDAGVAARGGVCFVSLGGEDGLAGLGGALAIGRDAFCVLHVSPPLLRAALAATEGTASAALLRADARGERPLLALVCGDLIACGMRVAVLKRELAWLGARLALAGAVSAQAFLPERLVARLTDGPVAG
jgi:hypothetical protein